MKNTTVPGHEMQSCIDACLQCHRICLQTALNHCLEMGGRHIEPEHYRLMMSCAEICQTSGNFQLGSSRFSAQLCALCAEICDACATDCEQIGQMDDCVNACRKCAQSCYSMASAMR